MGRSTTALHGGRCLATHIGADIFLGLDGALGAEKHRRAVAVALERHAVVRDPHRALADDVGPPVRLLLVGRARPLQLPLRVERFSDAAVGQREHLKSPAVRDERPAPAGEGVDAARRPDDVRPGVQEQVVGVGEDELLSRRVGRREIEGLQRGVRPHGHETGGVDDAVRRRDPPHPRRALAALMQHLEPKVFFGRVRPRREVGSRRQRRIVSRRRRCYATAVLTCISRLKNLWPTSPVWNGSHCQCHLSTFIPPLPMRPTRRTLSTPVLSASPVVFGRQRSSFVVVAGVVVVVA